MNIGIIIQARLSSQRLPGKVLTPLAGRPLLAYLFERLERAQDLPPWLLATSDTASDKPLVDYCREHQHACFAGPLDDVAARFLAAANSRGWEYIVRISGDSPLLDPEIIRGVLGLYFETLPDLATNVQPRTFPRGQSAEVFSRALLADQLEQMSAEEREHVTLRFYKQQSDLRIVNLSTEPDLGHVQLAIDTPMDFKQIEDLIDRFERPHWDYGYRELAEALTA